MTLTRICEVRNNQLVIPMPEGYEGRKAQVVIEKHASEIVVTIKMLEESAHDASFKDEKTSEPSTNEGTQLSMQTPLSEKITAALDGLLYISESEAPVELLQWPDVHSLDDARKKIAALDGDAKPEDQTLQTVEDFLKPIERMAVPEDPVMQDIAKRWNTLLETFQGALREVEVIVGPVKDAHQQIYIVGFEEEGALALHTSAVIT